MHEIKKWFDIELTLMKNRKEELYSIPKDYINEIVINWQDTNSLSLSIPSHVVHQGEALELPLFNLIRGGQQLILSVNGKKYKFIVYNISEDSSKQYATKQVECHEYQKKLEKQDFIIGDAVLTRQLYKSSDEKVEVADGVLNLFEQQCLGWKVGHIDQKAKQELTLYYPSFKESLYTNLTVSNVQVGASLFSKSINIGQMNQPLNMTLVWNVSVYDANNKLYINTTQEHDFTNLPYPVSNIKAEYYSDEQYYYGIKYTLTYSNGFTGEFKFNFVNCRGVKLVANAIDVIYETGELEENWVTKYRSFETQVCSWTSMLQQIEEAFECVITFDSYNQVINVYDKEECGIDTGLDLTYDNVLRQVAKSKNIEEVVTKLNVESSNVDIANYNPLGTNYIENYDYYINNDIMSEELKASMIGYKKLLEQKDIEYKTILLGKTRSNQTLTLKNSQLKSLEGKYTAENSILSAYIKAEDKEGQERQQTIVVDLENQISAIMLEIQTLKDTIANYETQMIQIATDINKENATWNGKKLFTSELLLELSDYTYESTITDDTYLTGSGLYNHAVKVMSEMQKPTIEFDIRAVFDFFRRIENANGFSDLIYVGGKYNLTDEDIATNGQVMLYQFKILPKSDTLSDFKFTNKREEPETAIRKIQKTSQTANATKSLTDFYKSTLNDAKNNMVNVNKILNEGLDLAAQQVRQRKGNNLIDMSEAGIFLIDAEDENNQLALINNLITMTTDRWKTSRVGISPSGVVAETLIGGIILSEEVYIGNGDNTFKILPEGLYIYDNDASHSLRVFLGIDEDNKARLRLYSANGDNSLVLSEEGIYNCYQISDRDSFDYYNSFKSYFYIPNTLQRTFEAKLIVQLQPFRAYSKTSASGGKFTSTKTSAGGGNFNITSDTVSGGGYQDVITSEEWAGRHTTRGPQSSEGEGANSHYESHWHWVDSRHSHNITIKVPPHSHNFNVSQGKHSHDVSIEIPAHTHESVYGIYEANSIPTVKVYMSGREIATLNSNTQFLEIDVTQWFDTLTKGSNTIEFKTTQTDGLARASFTLFWSGFYSYE